MKTLILTDNAFALEVAIALQHTYKEIDIFQSPNGPLPNTPRLNVMEQIQDIITKYNLVLSIHCKQLFPAELVNTVRCVNVHPGLNPYNRGWFPQVFSIINGLKAGVTIHEMDDKLDHGPIIIQKEYTIESWDTSASAYAKIMKIEQDLILDNFSAIREGNYRTITPHIEGNINYMKDFNQLRCLDLEEKGKFRDFLNRLRALTHDDFRNAYFVDTSGRKVFVRVILEPENS
jgi:dTDP-4-amino-4,6-dideoxyglucose formyltransferase